MKKLVPAIFLLVLSACGGGGSGGSASLPQASPPPPKGAWTLQWSDEFSGASGAPVDATKWVSDVGGDGWGNRELEYYTNATAPAQSAYTTKNAYQDGSGNLVIEADKVVGSGYSCSYGPCLYTSARLTTLAKFSQAYGRFEARIKIPSGQGVWPAFWMLGANISSAGFPACGEIDVMENIGKEPSTAYGSAHGTGFDGAAISAGYTLPGGAHFSDDFHVFAVEWSQNPAQLQYFVDGALYETITPSSVPAGGVWAFDHPFFIILNLALGGDWPGAPDATTPFPARMLVDYVRVYGHT